MSTKAEVEEALQMIATRSMEPAVQEKIKGFKRNLTLTFKDLDVSYLFKPQSSNFEVTTPQQNDKETVQVVTDAETFLGILHGKVDAFSAFATGRIKVNGSISDLLKLQQLLKQF